MNDAELKRKLFEDLVRQKKADFNRLKLVQRDQLGTINSNGLDQDLLENRKENQMQQVRLKFELIREIEESIKDLEAIHSIPVRDTVSALAMVRTDRQNFLIFLPQEKLRFGDEQFIGISTRSPIYKTMQGKKVGDSFRFGDIQYKITAIA
jgi:transcription elongation GreA/GreB family factor